MRSGEYIGASIVLNTLTKFGKLAVGKHVVSAKQRHSGDLIFPLTVAISGKSPLTKVSVEYEPQPKNIFQIRVNDYNIYSLVKEEVDYDPTKMETLFVNLRVNGKTAIDHSMPWIVDEVEEKIQNTLGMDNLDNIVISDLNCKTWVANEFLDVLTC